MSDDRRRRRTLLALAVVSAVALGVSVLVDRAGSDGDRASRDASTTTTEPLPEGEFFRGAKGVLADPTGFGQPYPNAEVEGLLTFRGNPSRSYYGVGPVPRTPTVLTRFPREPMCRESENLGTTKVWCGLGWTGQPLIVEREDRRWAIFGGYDGNIHFVDALTGERIVPDIETGDIIKGTPTVDPDGFPLVYSGSRDDLLRIVAFDRPGAAEVLWTLDSESVGPVLWNDDWDSSPIVLGDYLVVGSESSRFWVVKLNRTTDRAGLVQVAPEVVFTTEAWDAEVLASNGDEVASVESSVAVHEDTVYFGTSAGLILGYDLRGVATGRPPRKVFRFYTGGDNDASVVVDEDGYLYVASQYDRDLDRAREVGQLTKLDPSNTVKPIVWKLDDATALKGGIYGTPGIYERTVYVGTNGGRLIGVDQATGAIRWERRLPPPLWGSPVIVDDTLLIGDCEGTFHAFDVSNPLVAPPERWAIELGGCIEATPAVWDGRIYIGTRAGHLYILGEPAGATTPTPSARSAGASSSSTTTTKADR
ncbi:MAG: PQQ-binding-like beta-propeller repeat protein [Acidimicrobiales bacterium]|nr:PQQ-binding-like beta-propeller repeat protein [Acidimicrobiales bacterium]